MDYTFEASEEDRKAVYGKNFWYYQTISRLAYAQY
jgi:hypothetical protein